MAVMNPEVILSKANDLHPLSQAATKLLTIIDNPLISRDEVAKIISRDEVLTANVFRHANSAAVNSRVRFTDLNNVIDALGLNTIKNIALFVAVRDSITDEHIWYESVFVSNTCLRVSELIKEQDEFKNECFYLALFHRFGELIFRQFYSEEFLAILEKAQSYRHRLELEKEYFGINHLEISTRVLSDWGVPENIIKSIESHKNLAEGFEKKNAIVEVSSRLWLLENANTDELKSLIHNDELKTNLEKHDLINFAPNEEEIQNFFLEAESILIS